MTDIRFDLNYMHMLQGDFTKAEGDVISCAHGFQTVSQKMEGELSAFNAEGVKAVREIQSQIFEIRDMKSDIDRKITSAEGNRKKEMEIPPRPSVPSNATNEQRSAIMSSYNDKVSQIQAKNAKIREENQKIDEFKCRCEGAKSKLEELISKLHQLEEAVKKEIEHTASKVHSFMGQANSLKNDFSRASGAMGEFNHAFKETYDAAQALYLMEPSGIRSFSYNDKQFVIKNTHSHILGSGSFVGFHFSGGGERESAFKVTDVEKTDTKAEVLIKDRDEQSFFESVGDSEMIKMPSSNLHKLGGKRFTAQMNEKGYVLVTQKDGSTIDSSGMLHWEKRR